MTEPSDARRDAPAAAPVPTVLDRGALESLLGNDPTALRAVLEDFMGTLDDDLDELMRATDAQDLAAVTRQAHRMKRAALSVGALELSGSAAKLESAARAPGRRSTARW